MTRYLAIRLALFVPTLLIASAVVFLIMRVAPGDVAEVVLSGAGETAHDVEQIERVREELGLDEPLAVQYGDWLLSLVNGDFGGRSFVSREGIPSIIGRQAPVTLLLTLYAGAAALLVAIPLGALAARAQDRWPDYAARAVSIAGQSAPAFVLALVVLLVLLIVFGWTPPLVYADPWEDPWRHVRIMVVPALVLGFGLAGALVRMTRASVLETLGQDYVRAARGKGLAERVILFRHALRPAAIPIVTVGALQAGALLSGAVVVEVVFGLPGLGRGIADAAAGRDYPVVQALAMLLVFFVLCINLIADTAYAVLDPRVAYRA